MSYQAAWINESKGKPLQVEKAGTYQPDKDQLLIKNSAVAINPVDWKIQDYGINCLPLFAGFMMENYPNILGEDIAGEVVEIGAEVTRFKKGDRVISHCKGLATGSPENGAFQLYTVAFENLTSPIPESLMYEKAVVLPPAISTAASGLYMKDYLNLAYPSQNAKETNKVLFVNGASSSVGAIGHGEAETGRFCEEGCCRALSLVALGKFGLL
ncbi:oxidoreductase-like protein [Venturia nashicola]|uniref:Oxidoreductase-like protein n=1 Tax=Venturia nashicola TaxID=86259 RepID=A0A4Z1P586_9PEZI|nr:oxidoreductase-like protein [Venturia nashicola]TLD23547.1 oxidoreductase-like protein [Venturia nashicola]